MKKGSKYRWVAGSSLFRILSFILIIYLAVSIVTLVLCTQSIAQVEKQISQDIQSALELNMGQIDYQLNRLNYRLYFLSTSNESYVRINSKIPKNNEELQAERNAITKLRLDFDDILLDYSWIDNLFAYFPEKGYFIGALERNVDAGICLVQVLEEAPEEVANARWQPVMGLDHVLARTVEYRGSYYGAWMNLNNLLEESTLAIANDGNNLFFTDKDGRILSDLDVFSSLGTMKNGENIEVDHNRYVVLKADSGIGDFSIVNLVPRSSIDHMIPVMLRTMLAVALGMLLSLPFLVFFMAKYMAGPIVTLMDAMTEIEKGNLKYRITKQYNSREFQMINRHFNDMMDEVEQLKINVYEKELAHQNIKMQYLSQQIQPHFILNAMNIIYSYEPEEYDQIQEMVLCLTKYFRFIIDARRPYVELRYEFEHIDNYFSIEQIRHPDRLEYTISYDEQAGRCLIPPLIIQNLADNINKHAIRANKKTHVDLTACAEGDDIHIVLTDDGKGISDEVLSLIHEYRRSGIPPEGLGVGLQNTIDRLQIFFGGRADISIDKRTDGNGTMVDIRIPFQEEHKEEMTL